jgi:hypothetical protein
LRFAFYGRTSTEDYQDRASSEYWQRDVAENVISGRGVVVVEFFDSGYSRRLPWVERPEAAALLDAVADPDRAFDAIVVGEFERAFYGNQLQQLMPVFDRYGVQLWLPETDGPLDLTDVTHQALMMLLGAQSRREVLRSRHRVTAAMRAQVCDQAGIWVVGRRTGTGWLMLVRIRTVRTRSGDAGCGGSTLIRERRRMCVGCSLNVSREGAWLA